ncbi:hypothetical protein P154DRAFT_578404 [Amniculicola lignicola CBS 123094]|uniref:Uncharacterized protein n=1 Tax=Amniculicola lignicola CBS 123094 TaxID=1392246 RepID=A0A6A5W7X9_9PLEO|nr:hypothetical protein P154DRAFT_578404 [Amniculicola lignicola CBS 123094]
MDPRLPPHPFTRPERSLIHNPNHQSSSQPPPTGPSYSYPPASQPQPPVHVPFNADPYPPARRDPFLPSAAHQHARRSSYGLHGEGGPPGQGERHTGWGNTGTLSARGSHILEGPAVVPPRGFWCAGCRSMSWALVARLTREPWQNKNNNTETADA